MKSEFVCREASEKDQGAIVDFQLKMALETEDLKLDPAVCELGVQAVFKDSQLGKYFVVEKSGAVVGSLLIVPEWSDWRNGMVWWIHSVYIVPTERNNGAFKTFYQYIQKKVEADPGVRGLRLYVDKRNARAQAIYKRLGMNNEHYELYEWMCPPKDKELSNV